MKVQIPIYYDSYSCNNELLPKTPFISNKKVFEFFKDKKKYHQEFEAHKLQRAKEVKEYLEKSIKCKCGKPARIAVDDPYDIESLSWVDNPDQRIKVMQNKFESLIQEMSFLSKTKCNICIAYNGTIPKNCPQWLVDLWVDREKLWFEIEISFMVIIDLFNSGIDVMITRNKMTGSINISLNELGWGFHQR